MPLHIDIGLAQINVRTMFMGFMVVVVLIAAICNAAVGRNADTWSKTYSFSLHAAYVDPNTVQASGSVGPVGMVQLVDNSNHTHAHCTIFRDKPLEKCKMMRSPPMYLQTVKDKWPFLENQMTFAQTKDMFFVFLAFTGFWWSQYAISEGEWAYQRKHYIRTVVIFMFGLLVFIDFIWQNAMGWAEGSYTTAIAIFMVCGAIIVLEYAFKKQQSPAEEKASDVNISTPKREHMRYNIYLSYAGLLMFAPVVLFVLSNTHDALFDVHIQLVFFSFVFYATLDLFQTRTTAVLMCILDETDKLSGKLRFLQFFVVLAFVLCKCFVLLPSLVLIQNHYQERMFQQVMLAVHYVVIIGFALADLVHIAFHKMDWNWKQQSQAEEKGGGVNIGTPKGEMETDLIKLLVMIAYTSIVFFGAMVVDAPIVVSSQ